MSFTNEDLKRLKEQVTPDIHGMIHLPMSPDMTKALIDRLEKAEKCIIPEELIGSREADYKAWLKSKGAKGDE